MVNGPPREASMVEARPSPHANLSRYTYHARHGWPSRLALASLLIVLYVPLIFLFLASINDNPASTNWTGFSWRWYQEAFNDPALRRALRVSLRLATTTAVLATLIGTVAAIATRRTRWMGRVSSALSVARIGAPEIILATGLKVALSAAGIKFGFTPMLVAHVAYLSGFVVLIVGARAAGSVRSHEEAALDLGARRWRVVRDIVVPDLLPAILSSALLVLAFSFDDVALSLALRGPNDTTVPIYIFSAVQRRVTPSIHAIGTLVILAGIVTFAAAAVLNKTVFGGADRAASASSE
jgi:spermidine/putrescine transport system permease protein